MIFKQTTQETPTTKQLILNKTAIAPADSRDDLVYDGGIPDRLIFNSLSDKDLTKTIELNPIMVIGRKRNMRDYEVNVDLTDMNGAELGVSHFHAMVLVLDSLIHIKDIDSLNGMRINGRQMIPSKEYIIDNGDILAFGNLEVKVKFEYD